MTFQAIPRAILALAISATCAPSTHAQQSEDRGVVRLQQRFEKRIEQLRSEITAALPEVRSRAKKAHLATRAAEKAAEAKVATAKENLAKVGSARGLVEHAKGKWIGGADKGIAKAKKQLENATTTASRTAARKELAKWKKNREEGVRALKERKANFDKLTRSEPRWKRELKSAEKAVAAAKARTQRSVAGLRLESLLKSDGLDARLAEFVVLLEATPRGLAEFSSQGREHQKLVDSLLGDPALMVQMVVADGAKDGRYGQAMKIYDAIRTASDRSSSGTLQRFALAVALEHATPVKQRNPEGSTNAPETVDPVARYRHYEAAFLDKALDPGFANLSVWDYRMVVDGSEPDDTLAWGREMLCNYRPDHVYTSDYRWRYVASVRTDIRYGSQDNKHDRDDLQFFQNILMNGGVCGRRAFFGRFILRAHGVPTTARPQRGHAALTHWTPDGWVVCLGGGWGAGWTKTRYKRDRDFLATTQARRDIPGYMEVKRAQWIGDVAREKRVFGFLSGDPDFWYGVSLYRQRQLIKNAKTLAAVGEELGEANESHVQYAVEAAKVTEADRKIVVDADGVITIPAVATSEPTKSSGKIIFMPSNLGGKQLHYSRNGRARDFEYTFDAPAAGTYRLCAKVVTPSWNQHLQITANNTQTVDLALPHTIGMWQSTDPIDIELVEGRNVLRFAHKCDGYAKGFTIREFQLTPGE